MVSFDVLNMFPSIDNKMRIESVKNILLNRDIILPSECIIEDLALCLNFNNQRYLDVLLRVCIYPVHTVTF